MMDVIYKFLEIGGNVVLVALFFIALGFLLMCLDHFMKDKQEAEFEDAIDLTDLDEILFLDKITEFRNDFN